MKPNIEASAPAAIRFSPTGPNSARPASAKGLSEPAKPGTVASATAWINTYRTTDKASDASTANGASVLGFLASPAGTGTTSKP